VAAGRRCVHGLAGNPRIVSNLEVMKRRRKRQPKNSVSHLGALRRQGADASVVVALAAGLVVETLRSACVPARQAVEALEMAQAEVEDVIAAGAPSWVDDPLRPDARYR